VNGTGTMTTPLPRPAADDAAPYYFTYIDRVPEGDVLAVLAGGVAETRRALAGVTPEREGFRYNPGKWTVREVVGHVLDAERVFGYRAFHFARGDAAPLPSMEQDAYAVAAGAGRRPLADLLDELEHLRLSHLRLFRGFDREAWERTGVASGVRFRVRSLPFILAGHEIHHRRVLVERYLSG
jgi:DinB superfamily